MPEVDAEYYRVSHLIKKGNILEMRAWLRSGGQPNLRNRFGWTLLMSAALRGRTDMAELLVAAGADPALKNKWGDTALACAEEKGFHRTAAFLAGALERRRGHGGARGAGGRMGDWLHRCWTKATTAEGDAVRRSFSWVLARRGFLKIFADRLECGDWVIPYADMSEAVLFGTRQLLFHGYVLRVKAAGRTYQFGLNPGRFWEGELPFPVKRQETAMGYSWYSIAVRLAILAALAYYLLIQNRPGCAL